MLTKIVATILGAFLLGIMYLNTGVKTQAQDSTGHSYQSAITSKKDTVPTKDVIDSAKIVRDQFVAQKESLKDKIQVLQEKQIQIKETQQRIDSFVTSLTASRYPCQ